MTCCERLALGLTAVTVTALGNLDGALDLLATIENSPHNRCELCARVEQVTVASLRETMESYGDTSYGLGAVAMAVQELVYGRDS